MQEKKSKQLFKARLVRDRQIYEMRKSNESQIESGLDSIGEFQMFMCWVEFGLQFALVLYQLDRTDELERIQLAGGVDLLGQPKSSRHSCNVQNYW
jgi:hypothetical protein